MKELSIEEKAKRYDEAIEKFDVILNLNTVKESGTIFANDVRKIFPELAETEDERVKNFISNELMCLRAVEYNSGSKDSDRYKELTSAIAWLEKQGEKKPADKVGVWSEEDEEMFYYALDMIEWYNGKNEGKSRIVSNWLKSLKDRIQPQPKQEWSDDDEKMLMTIIDYTISDNILGSKYINFLKSLRPRSQWKPSDEQMENLTRAINGGSYRTGLLIELYQDLKKL